MSLMVFRFARVHGPYQPGDLLAVDPQVKDGFALVRMVPVAFGVILGALEAGACEPVTDGLLSADVRSLVADRLAALAPDLPEPVRRLVRLK